jgi:putative ABC transport system ATP-binding protein
VNAEAVMLLMLALCRRGIAGVVVTHDARIASRADRVVFLQDGQVISRAQAGSDPDTLLAPGAQR